VYANVEDLVPVQLWTTPETRIAFKLAARRQGLTMTQAGGEALVGWLEYAARAELNEARLIAQEHAEEGMLIEA
jgi:hypothetical protein